MRSHKVHVADGVAGCVCSDQWCEKGGQATWCMSLMVLLAVFVVISGVRTEKAKPHDAFS